MILFFSFSLPFTQKLIVSRLLPWIPLRFRMHANHTNHMKIAGALKKRATAMSAFLQALYLLPVYQCPEKLSHASNPLLHSAKYLLDVLPPSRIYFLRSRFLDPTQWCKSPRNPLLTPRLKEHACRPQPSDCALVSFIRGAPQLHSRRPDTPLRRRSGIMQNH